MFPGSWNFAQCMFIHQKRESPVIGEEMEKWYFPCSSMIHKNGKLLLPLWSHQGSWSGIWHLAGLEFFSTSFPQSLTHTYLSYSKVHTILHCSNWAISYHPALPHHWSKHPSCSACGGAPLFPVMLTLCQSCTALPLLPSYAAAHTVIQRWTVIQRLTIIAETILVSCYWNALKKK